MEMGLITHDYFWWKIIFLLVVAWAYVRRDWRSAANSWCTVWTLYGNIFKSCTKMLCKDRRLIPICVARRLVDVDGASMTSSATAAVFSAERLLRGLPRLAASRVVPVSSRRAAKRRSVSAVGVGRLGNLRKKCTLCQSHRPIIGQINSHQYSAFWSSVA